MRALGTAVISLCLLGVALPARADDPRPAPAPRKAQSGAATWSGAYVGVSGGLGWRGEPIALIGANGIDEFISPTGVPSSIAKDATGLIIGGQAGYSHQAGGAVIGFEGDFSMTTIEKTEDDTGIVGVERYTHGEKKLEWISSLRGRVGFAAGSSALIYATGGLAFGRATSAIMLTTTTKNDVAGCIVANVGVCVADEQTKTVNGWILGGGAEFRAGARVSIKAEYLLYDLGEVATEAADARFAPNPLPTLFGTDRVKGSVMRAGVNFRF